MPDAWEDLHGFDPTNPSDGALDANSNGYTNVEEYLNRTESSVTAMVIHINTAIIGEEELHSEENITMRS